MNVRIESNIKFDINTDDFVQCNKVFIDNKEVFERVSEIQRKIMQELDIVETVNKIVYSTTPDKSLQFFAVLHEKLMQMGFEKQIRSITK